MKNMQNKNVSQSQSGLTLIEMIVVVAIIAILAALAIPNINSYIQNARLTGRTEEFQRDLQFARSEAIKNNRPVWLRVIPASSCYGLTLKTGACNCTQTDNTANDYCELKRITSADLSTTTLAAGVATPLTAGGSTGTTGNFGGSSGLAFDQIRAMPVGVTTDQTAQFSNPSGKKLYVRLSVAGLVTVCTPTDSSKVNGYNAGC